MNQRVVFVFVEKLCHLERNIDELRNDEKKLKNVFLVFDCLKLVFEC